MRQFLGLVSLLGITAAAPAWAAQSRSEQAARELVQVLQQANLQSIAAVDPDDQGRFIAGMLFPGQLLVISAKYPSPEAMNAHLKNQSYGEVYAALHGIIDAAGRIFVQDLGADGLHAEDGGTVDIVYEDGVTRTLFDGHPEKRDQSKSAYAQKFQDLDQKYARMLQLLRASAEGD